jgi:3-deoxy-D-manno-octulosonic-acid transferase
METTYRIVAWAVNRLPLPAGKLAAILAGRRAAAERWRSWAERDRREGRLVWLHAASVGEALAAQPVVRRLRAALPGLQVVLTHTSPSVTGRGSLAGADHADYLPRDEPTPMARTLDALRPDLLLFSRGDIWPELTRQAHARGVPLAVTGGVVRPRSGRLRWPARAVLRPVCRLLDYVGAVTDGDAERWHRLGVPAGRIEVTGDPRHDQLIERPVRQETLEPLRAWARRCVIVAGSVEGADERVVLAAAAGLRSDAAVRWLIVPHDPSVAVARRLLTAAQSRGLEAAPWSGEGSPPADATLLVLTTRGLLADLYALGSIAYVGGGFRRRGLHAVAEPAALGLPVLFGPRWQDVPDAAALVASGGGIPVPRRAPLDSLGRTLRNWARHPEQRVEAGRRARTALVAGAADRSAQALIRHLAQRPLPHCPRR